MNVLIMFGGVSSEHDVSLVSATSVINNIDKDKFNVLMLGITKDGRWLFYDGCVEDIVTGKWQEHDCIPAQISLVKNSHELLLLGDGTIDHKHIDCVFPVMHGKNGEDGTVQALFTLAGIPFVGCDMLSSAMSMDKQTTNIMADYAQIRQAKWTACLKGDYNEKFVKQTVDYLGFPIFVKPANAGSSVGISKAKNIDELNSAAQLAFSHDRKVVFEECIVGREVECAVLGNENPLASCVGEIVACAEFYDYDAKYVGDSKLYIPANIPDDTSEKIRKAAINVYKTMGCSGLSRVDFFIGNDGNIYFNELNTIPGFTSISMYPKLFDAVGVPYTELITRLINFAIDRYEA